MRPLIDKSLILLLCIVPFITTEITSSVVSGALFAVITASVCQFTEKKRLPGLVLEVTFGIMSVIMPEISFFSALPLYEAARTKDKAGAAAICAGILGGIFHYRESCLISFAVCILAVYLSISSVIFGRQHESLIRSRDAGVESERLLKRRNRELQENLDYELKINTLNERNRIAREIHDNVGHILSGTLLQTGALCAMCPKEQTAVKKGLEELKENLYAAMESIRKSVHGIRDESLDMRVELEKITSGIKERFKTETVYDVNGELPPKVKLCFIAILKEAVSNISKHSSGDRVQIIVREHPALYQLIVYDNGNGRIRNGGMGMEDMRQRAEDLGGNFRVSDEKGFTVFVSVKKTDNMPT